MSYEKEVLTNESQIKRTVRLSPAGVVRKEFGNPCCERYDTAESGMDFRRSRHERPQQGAHKCACPSIAS